MELYKLYYLYSIGFITKEEADMVNKAIADNYSVAIEELCIHYGKDNVDLVKLFDMDYTYGRGQIYMYGSFNRELTDLLTLSVDTYDYIRNTNPEEFKEKEMMFNNNKKYLFDCLVTQALITIRIGDVTVTNEFGSSIKIEGLYVIVKMNHGQFSALYGVTTVMDYEKMTIGYMHSHLPRNEKYYVYPLSNRIHEIFSSQTNIFYVFCLGVSPLANMVYMSGLDLLNKENEEEERNHVTTMAFNIDEYLKIESIKGGPHVRMSEIKRYSGKIGNVGIDIFSNDNTRRYNSYNDDIIYEIASEVCSRMLNNNELKYTVNFFNNKGIKTKDLAKKLRYNRYMFYFGFDFKINTSTKDAMDIMARYTADVLVDYMSLGIIDNNNMMLYESLFSKYNEYNGSYFPLADGDVNDIERNNEAFKKVNGVGLFKFKNEFVRLTYKPIKEDKKEKKHTVSINEGVARLIANMYTNYIFINSNGKKGAKPVY